MTHYKNLARVKARADTDLNRRRLLRAAALAPFAVGLSACGGGGSSNALAPATRTYSMGFYPNPPEPTVQSILDTVDAMSTHAELMHIHEELPWTDLLNGQSADDAANGKSQLVTYARSKGLRFGFMADLTDGLDRSKEPPQLVALGRSITESQVQSVYRAYVRAVAVHLQPDYIGLNAETNLVRLQAAPAVYDASVQAANAGAADLAMAGYAGQLMISVQADVAWGQANGGQYQGVETDFADFPFLQMLGISSYPYFNNTNPELPTNYYSRLLNGRNLPAMVAEGGWSSASGVGSTPDLQRQYIERQAELLDAVHATALIQTLYADLDLSGYPTDLQTALLPFASIGLVDSNFAAKPALAAWDSLFDRRKI